MKTTDKIICKCKAEGIPILIEKKHKAGSHYGLYCSTCGRWLKWVVKNPISKNLLIKNKELF